MIKRASIVAEALAWRDTPFLHQAHTRGLATDCIGFAAGVGIACGVFAADSWEREFAQYAGYGRTPANGALEAVCRRYLVEVDIAHARPADVLLMRFAVEPQHLAILVPYQGGGLAMVHAYSRAGKVIEHRYADVWKARTVAAFAYPGLSDEVTA